MSENEKKKEYLRGYGKHIRRIGRIESELAELRSMRSSVSVNNNGMPRGSVKSDLSGYAADLDCLERDLLQEKFERIEAYENITDRINELSDENEKDVLFYKYIKRLEWWEVAEKMGYSERWVLKLHGKALVHFKLPKEFIEVHPDL